MLACPSGTGKALLAKALATKNGVNFIAVNSPELFSELVGDSERGVHEVFMKARQAAPSILHFDKLDAIILSRVSGESGSYLSERIVGQFLLEMDRSRRSAG